MLQNIDGLGLEVLKDLSFDRRRDLLASGGDTVTYPFDFRAALALMISQAQSKRQPDQHDDGDQHLGSDWVCLDADNRVIHKDLDACFSRAHCRLCQSAG